MLADGIHGMAVAVNGEKDYIDFGHPVELRLMGSMTISAWINSSSFPIDDAAIVSTLHPGYQLDTTVDKGPRTIGFKLTDPCGKSMARYGATELVRDTWYHVAGVYDADGADVNVYLNGHLDDGFLGGPVASAQRRPASLFAWVDGRKSEGSNLPASSTTCASTPGVEQVEIEKTMNGVRIDSPAARKAARTGGRNPGKTSERSRRPLSSADSADRAEDATVPGLMVAVGMLSALACAGFWPGHRLFILGVSSVVGLLVVPAAMIICPNTSRG